MNHWTDKARRIRALVVKETRQVARDPSSIAIGVVLPLILILLFGYGLSLDVKDVPGRSARRLIPDGHGAGRWISALALFPHADHACNASGREADAGAIC